MLFGECYNTVGNTTTENVENLTTITFFQENAIIHFFLSLLEQIWAQIIFL